MVGKIGEEIELLRGEIECGAFERRLVMEQVEVEGPHVKLRWSLAIDSTMAERNPQPSIELAHAERLGHIVIRAIVQSFYLAVLRSVRREDNDGYVAPRPDSLAYLQAVQIRQAEVKHNDVRRTDRRLSEPLVPFLRSPHCVTQSF
jgi:hypothetical protein